MIEHGCVYLTPPFSKAVPAHTDQSAFFINSTSVVFCVRAVLKSTIAPRLGESIRQLRVLMRAHIPCADARYLYHLIDVWHVCFATDRVMHCMACDTTRYHDQHSWQSVRGSRQLLRCWGTPNSRGTTCPTKSGSHGNPECPGPR